MEEKIQITLTKEEYSDYLKISKVLKGEPSKGVLVKHLYHDYKLNERYMFLSTKKATRVYEKALEKEMDRNEELWGEKNKLKRDIEKIKEFDKRLLYGVSIVINIVWACIVLMN